MLYKFQLKYTNITKTKFQVTRNQEK